MRNKLFLFVFLFAMLAIVDSHAFERKKYNFNSEWRLQIGDFPEAKQSQFDDSRWKAVTLPHAFNEDEAFKVSIEQQGPNSQPGNIRIKSGDEGLHLNLMFDFR